MAKAVFSAPGDVSRVVAVLRTLHAKLSDLRAVRPLTRKGTDAERLAAAEEKVNEILARLVAVTKE